MKSFLFFVIASGLRHVHFRWRCFLMKEFIKNSPSFSRKLTSICPLWFPFMLPKPCGPTTDSPLVCTPTLALKYPMTTLKWAFWVVYKALEMSSYNSSTSSSEYVEVDPRTFA
ncbi:unnamed protein product [Spodoptera exigua]|nr:unnamed protein product [Spodoptera exigua]